MYIFETFFDAYTHAAKKVLAASEVELYKPGKTIRTREIRNHTFSVQTPTTLDMPKKRKRYELAEMLWYAAGDYTLPWISKYTKFWQGIADDDGTIRSNYGMRIFRDQKTFLSCFTTLVHDPSSRQAVCHINLPFDIASETKDLPCTMFLQFFIRDNTLEMHTVMRSNDIWKGLTYDAPNFMVFHQNMYYLLKCSSSRFDNLRLGSYHHTAMSLHIYEQEYTEVEKSLSEYSSLPLILTESLITSDGQPLREVHELYLKCFEDPEKVFEFSNYFKSNLETH